MEPPWIVSLGSPGRQGGLHPGQPEEDARMEVEAGVVGGQAEE